ncbi:MAG: hypothetical protein N2489_07740 [Clostridia bacterium]|nr:hypothetical protein [Clostridia bacterium]
MRLFFKLIIMSFLIILPACSNNDLETGPKREVVLYSEKTLSVDGEKEVVFDVDYGNMEIYCWDKKELKFEIAKRLRGMYKKERLEEMLKDFSVEIKQCGDTGFFKSRYKGNIKKPADKSLDVKATIPRNTRLIKCSIGNGSIKVLDDINCDMEIDAREANVEINTIRGMLISKSETGWVKISGGRLKPGTAVNTKKGSMYIKTELEKKGQYSFEAGVGNVELSLPEGTDIEIVSQGSVGINEFNTVLSPLKLSVKSELGKVNIKKYSSEK